MSQTKEQRPRTTTEDLAVIRQRLVALVESIRDQVPPEITEEEMERDAEQAIAAVRRKRRARRS